jgi:hypothetical protein
MKTPKEKKSAISSTLCPTRPAQVMDHLVLNFLTLPTAIKGHINNVHNCMWDELASGAGPKLSELTVIASRPPGRLLSSPTHQSNLFHRQLLE